MSFNWMYYFDLAKWLDVSTPSELSEAAKRTVVSRSYYSSHHLARQYALNSKTPPTLKNDGTDHRTLINYYKSYGKKPIIGNCLYDLLTWRQMCDYTDNVPNLDDMTTNAIKRAQQIINQLQS